MSNQWNLILRSCKRCNKLKSDLENDISAISMQPDAWGQYAQQDPLLEFHSIRKAKRSKSQRTGKIVGASKEDVAITLPLMPGLNVTLDLSAPPHADSDRVFDLAWFHMTAFFYWASYQSEQKVGHSWPGEFMPLHETHRGDWGNPLCMKFTREIEDWHPRIIGTSANGYFKVVLRRNPVAICWGWALEWNQKQRVFGFLGERGPVEEIARTLPALETRTLGLSGGHSARYREEVPLAESDDRLFMLP